MDTLEQAKEYLESHRFSISEHISYEAPINDSSEIEKLRGQLEGAWSPKEKALLEGLLVAQIEGRRESLEAIKIFSVFEGVSKDRMPYVAAFFYPDSSIYKMNFLARDLRSKDHPLASAGSVLLSGKNRGEGKRLSLELARFAEKELGFPEGAHFLNGLNLDIRPTFVVQSEGYDFGKVYDSLICSLGKLGYEGL